MGEVVRYTFRLRPGAQAERALTEEWHRCRFLWNEAVHQQKSGARLTFGKLSNVGGIGVDWGVSATATATNGEFDLPYLGHRKRCAAELAKAQRKMARRHSGKRGPQSKGYERAKRQAARLQTKAARQTQHDSRVWAKRVVDNHELIAVEDFTPKFLARSTMARKAADAAIGAAKREPVERGVRAGRRVVLVRPAYTMTCSRCFVRAKQRLELDERTFRCTACSYTAGRDRNAAGVILAVAERGHTRVDDVCQSDHLPLGAGRVAVRA